MNILIAGIYRSGSTWLFNAVRCLCAESGKTKSGFIWWPLNGSAKYRVIKTHAFYDDSEMEFQPDIVVTSTRHVDHIILSMKNQRAKGLEPQFKNAGNFEEIETFQEWLVQWSEHPKHKYQMNFDDLHEKRTLKILHELNDALMLNLDNETILIVDKKLSRMRPPKNGFSKKTLLTPTHIK